MSLFRKLRTRLALKNFDDEAAYAAALREIESGARRDGLWAKALASSTNADEAKSKYIRLRVAALHDEQHLTSEFVEAATRQQVLVEDEAAKREAAENAELEQQAAERRRAAAQDAAWRQRPRGYKAAIFWLAAIWYALWGLVTLALGAMALT